MVVFLFFLSVDGFFFSTIYTNTFVKAFNTQKVSGIRTRFGRLKHGRSLAAESVPGSEVQKEVSTIHFDLAPRSALSSSRSVATCHFIKSFNLMQFALLSIRFVNVLLIKWVVFVLCDF